MYLVAVQLKLHETDLESIINYRRKIEATFEEICSEIGSGNALVAFPEHIGTFIYHILLKKKKILTASLLKASLLFLYNLPSRPHPLSALTTALSSKALSIYREIFCSNAEKYSYNVAAGSTLLPMHGKVYNAAYLFDETGRVVLIQKKVHLVDFEAKSLHISCGSIRELKVAEICGKRVGVAVCYDAFFNDVMARLDELRAEVLVQPSANPEVWNERLEKEWPRGCLEHLCKSKYGRACVNPMLVGDAAKMHFEGKSSIAVKDEDGCRYVERIEDPRAEGFIVVELP